MSARVQAPARAASQPASAAIKSGLLQRKCACGGSSDLTGECEQCRQHRLQRHPLSQVEPAQVEPAQAKPAKAPPIVREVLQSPGQPLEPSTRAFMEPRFGHDFSRVRVHTDARAAKSAQSVNAAAYTVGNSVVFGAGRYHPNSEQGQKLLAHELTHTIQQSAFAFSGASAPDSLAIEPAGTALEHDAENNAERMGGDSAGTPSSAMALQRAPDDAAENEIQSYVFAGDKRLKTDENFARKSGQEIAARILRSGALSRDLRLELNGMLAFFQDEAKEVYIQEIKPALMQVTREEIQMPGEDSNTSQTGGEQPKSAEDELADYIDQHPAWGGWGGWPGGAGSVEAYQEMEANFPAGEGSFYRSPEFMAWYFSGWRGLQKFPDPTRALQMVATVLITDESVRKKFFADLGISEVGGQVSRMAGKLDQARKAGKVGEAANLIEQIHVPGDVEQARVRTGQYQQLDLDAMFRGRELSSGLGLKTFERWTVDGVEMSSSEVSNIINQENAAKRLVPQVRKEFLWLGIDIKAGALQSPSEQTAEQGVIPAKAQGGISMRYYQLEDGRIITREFWHRVEAGEVERGNRALRVVWSNFMANLEGTSVADPYGAQAAYGTWQAGRMGAGGGRASQGTSSKSPTRPPAKPSKTQDTLEYGRVERNVRDPRRYVVQEQFGETNPTGAPQSRYRVDVQLDDQGIMHGDFMLRRQDAGGSYRSGNLRGKDEFMGAKAHFEKRNGSGSVKGIRSDWGDGDNLQIFNSKFKEAKARGLPDDAAMRQAAGKTFTGQWADEAGFRKITIVGAEKGAGDFTSVQVLFAR